ncbi:MAG TPA: VOC family protein [Candidatus Binatia bacterium]|nr:VOC family protein [Candidatus Binatia bacterium]
MSDEREGVESDERAGVEGRPIVVELFVSDIDRSLAFYRALGFEVEQRHGDWIVLRRGSIKLALQGDAHAVEGPHYFTPNIKRTPRGTGVEVAIQVADVDAEYIRAKTAGLNIVKGIQDRPWKARDFRVADPDGYFLRITSPLRGEERRA